MIDGSHRVPVQNLLKHYHPGKCVQCEILLGGASFVSLAGQHTFVDKIVITRLLFVNIIVYIFRIGPI